MNPDLYRLLDTSPQALAAQLADAQQKIARGAKLLAELKESDVEISLTPKDEVWRCDSVVLYRYRPEVERPLAVPAGSMPRGRRCIGSIARAATRRERLWRSPCWQSGARREA